jgi:PmbA protein
MKDGTRTFDTAARERDLLERAQALCDRALALGADGAEVYASGSETINVGFEKNDLKLTQVDEGRTLGLRVLVDGKQGFASTNQFDRAGLETTAADALTLARLSVPDAHNGLPEARPLNGGLQLVGRSLAELSVERVVEIARDFFARASSVDRRLSLDSASLALNCGTHALAASTGVRATESDALITLSLFGMAIEGEDVGGFDACGDCVRDPAQLESAIKRTIERFSETALGNLGARAGETYLGPVLFAPAAFYSVFASPLISAASAIAVQRGRSALAGKLGQTIAHPSLSIQDDPSDPGLAGARAFDREGQPARPFRLVENGALCSYLYNGYAARVDGCASTGHATGGADAVPGLGPHAVSVAPGKGGDRAAMLRALGRGLYIQRFSGTVDPASGDFSGVAKSARWVENGELARPLRETLISGNAFDLLGQIAALGSEAERVNGALRAPSALVDGVSVTAG